MQNILQKQCNSVKARAGKINPLSSTTADNLLKLNVVETFADLSKVFN